MDVFLNGRFLPESQAVVPISDRGFLYGDGLFETLRVYRGRPFRSADHWRRLERGAQFLKIRLPWSAAELESFARSLIERNKMPDAVLRITLSRGSGAGGYSTSGADNPSLAITLRPLPQAVPLLRLKTASLRVGAADPLATWKTTNKLLNILARAEAEASGADEALLLNSDGRVAEASASNVFWLESGTVATVPISEGALDGITRALVLELCVRRNIPFLEKRIERGELLKVEGVFLTNSVMGIIPVAELDGEALRMSPFVTDLQVAYEELVQTETSN